MNSRPTQLIDMIGKTIEILGRTFTVDWIDAPKSEDNGKVMVQSDETEIYHIGDRFEAVADVMSEISSELRKGKEVKEWPQRMTDRQTPKAKLTYGQYISLNHRISQIHAELGKMEMIIDDIEMERQDEHDASDGESFADCDDLDKIRDAIRFGHQRINEMRYKIRDVME